MQPAIELFGTNVLLIGIVVVLLVVGAVLIQRARQDAINPADDLTGDPLAAYRKAYEHGLMDFEEYRRILDSVDRRRNAPDELVDLARKAQADQVAPPETPAGVTTSEEPSGIEPPRRDEG